MAELLRNPITNHWVIVAENRGERPREVLLQPVVNEERECPFCEGAEHATPGEVLSRREPDSLADSPGWHVRVVPNKYPAVCGAERGVLAHEVIIETPRHQTSTTELDDAQFAAVLDIYRERIAQHEAAYMRHQSPPASAMLFKNNGPAAGATLAHLHSQLVVSALPTADCSARIAAFQNAADHPGRRCPACEMIDEARRDATVVAETDEYIALCPAASRLSYEMWLLPRSHRSRYSRINPESLPELASLFRGALVKLERVVKVAAYNYIIHSSPFDTSHADHYHWHIEILPRITTIAGFELGTGCYINPVSAERAAAELRSA